MISRILLQILFGTICFSMAAAARDIQADSIKKLTAHSKNHVRIRMLPDSTHNPKVAVRRSAIVPGLGQLYNNQWWKLPVIYAGMGALLGSTISTYQYYKRHLTVYQYYRGMTAVAKDMPEYQLYTDYKKTGITLNQLESAVNGAQRDTQFYYLCFAGAWGLQVIDAYIDAKLIHSYSMGPDLSFKLKPKLQLHPVSTNTFCAATFTPMLCMSFNF